MAPDFADQPAQGHNTGRPHAPVALPEKARLLDRLQRAGFPVPSFIYLDAESLEQEEPPGLREFLAKHVDDYKVIVRSCHPAEEFYRGGTFESLGTYADVGGVRYALKRIQRAAQTDKRLCIMRQQKFNHAPEINVFETGVLVMPFLQGGNVMAKQIGERWEFGYCRDRDHLVRSEPYITDTPHDRRLLKLSEQVQKHLGFKCEIEYVVGPDGTLHLVQAKDISKIDMLEQSQAERAVRLDGLHRIRRRRNFRERPIFVMDNQSFYLELISRCEDMVHGQGADEAGVADVLDMVGSQERDMERFALRHERYGVLGLSIEVPAELYQVANHYLGDTPKLQAELSSALSRNLYKVDQFLAEADTLIAQDKFRRNLCSHDAYGIDTVRYPPLVGLLATGAAPGGGGRLPASGLSHGRLRGHRRGRSADPHRFQALAHRRRCGLVP